MKLSRRSRWAVPAGGLVLTGALVAGIPALASSAQAPPKLPSRTPAQLLAQVAGAREVPPMQGTITETVSLGLPKLPAVADQGSITSILTGSHTFGFWYGGPGHLRISMPSLMQESDLYVEGSTAWLWQSVSNSAEKLSVNGVGGPRWWAGAPMGHWRAGGASQTLPVSPLQAANMALAYAGRSTQVTVGQSQWVAGQSAYTLRIAPKDPRSLVGHIDVAIDSANSVPLQVQVFARGAGSPAISVGFTQLSFTAPSPGDLAFSPPPGAKVTNGSSSATGTKSGADQAGLSGASVAGSGWLTVFEFPAGALQGLSKPQPTSGQGLAGASSAETSAAFGALLNDGAPVRGAWGSGTLVRTSLLSVLITNGKVYAGAVQPSVLFAAVK
jgi:hypothetical protein